jgi:hypothetical protein
MIAGSLVYFISADRVVLRVDNLQEMCGGTRLAQMCQWSKWFMVVDSCTDNDGTAVKFLEKLVSL